MKKLLALNKIFSSKIRELTVEKARAYWLLSSLPFPPLPSASLFPFPSTSLTSLPTLPFPSLLQQHQHRGTAASPVLPCEALPSFCARIDSEGFQESCIGLQMSECSSFCNSLAEGRFGQISSAPLLGMLLWWDVRGVRQLLGGALWLYLCARLPPSLQRPGSLLH